MKVTIKEESPDGTVVEESSVTFDKEEKKTEEDEPEHIVAPGPIAVCGLRSLICLLFGGACCGRKGSL